MQSILWFIKKALPTLSVFFTLGDPRLLAAINPSLSQIELDAKTLGEFHLLGTSHLPGMSATPVGRLKSLLFEDANKSFKTGWQLGYSVMQLPLDDKVKGAYQSFGADINALEDHFRYQRVHLNASLSPRMEIGLSYLFAPDIDLSGFGAHLQYSVIRISNYLFTSLRLLYSSAEMKNNFRTSSFGIEILQSLNMGFIDFYIGGRSVFGETEFLPLAGRSSLPTQEFDIDLGKLKQIVGVVMAPTKHIRLSFEAQSFNDENSYMGKLSFKLPSVVPGLPESWFRNTY